MDCGGLAGCEGTDYFASVIEDSTIAGKKYAVTTVLFPTPFIRQQGNQILAFDFADSTEFVLFDFSATPGDTISIRAQKTKFIVAQSNLTFVEYDTTQAYPDRESGWTIRDSIGVIARWSRFCKDCSQSAYIDRKNISLGVNEPSNSLILTSPVLEQIYPNPFNPATSIRFAVPTDCNVLLEVFNVLGQRIAILLNQHISSGWHSIPWDATNFAGGSYYCRLTADKKVLATSMLLVK